MTDISADPKHSGMTVLTVFQSLYERVNGLEYGTVEKMIADRDEYDTKHAPMTGLELLADWLCILSIVCAVISLALLGFAPQSQEAMGYLTTTMFVSVVVIVSCGVFVRRKSKIRKGFKNKINWKALEAYFLVQYTFAEIFDAYKLSFIGVDSADVLAEMLEGLALRLYIEVACNVEPSKEHPCLDNDYEYLERMKAQLAELVDICILLDLCGIQGGMKDITVISRTEALGPECQREVVQSVLYERYVSKMKAKNEV